MSISYLEVSDARTKFLGNNPPSSSSDTYCTAVILTEDNKIVAHFKRSATWYAIGTIFVAVITILVLAILLTRANIGSTGSNDLNNNGANLNTPTTVGAIGCTTPPIEEGPYFVDEKINQSYLYNTSTGLKLELTFPIYNSTTTQCTPIAGAQVDIWEADYMGLYSDEQSEGTLGKKWLRGYQVTDKTGTVLFTTIYPGYYSSRTVHVHIMVRTFDGTGKQLFRGTTQLYFDDSLTDQVYKLAPYNARAARSTRNSNDRIFTQAMVLPLVGSLQDGYAAKMPISVPFGV